LATDMLASKSGAL